MPATESTEIIPTAEAGSSLAGVQLGSLTTAGPKELVATATEIATTLKKIIADQKLSVQIQGRPYVKCEGWTSCAAMLGVVPREVAVTEEDGVYVATVELVRVSDGGIVGRASAECGAPDEVDKKGKPIWASRPRYARRSMALTRATAKACRLAFSWIITLGGYQPTPYEETPEGSSESAQSHRPKPRPGQRKKATRILGEVGAGRLTARLDQISATYDDLLDWLKINDQETWETISGVALDEIPAAVLNSISDGLTGLEQMNLQDQGAEAPDDEPAAEIDEDSIPF